jgi:hypothetical protein
MCSSVDADALTVDVETGFTESASLNLNGVDEPKILPVSEALVPILRSSALQVFQQVTELLQGFLFPCENVASDFPLKHFLRALSVAAIA